MTTEKVATPIRQDFTRLGAAAVEMTVDELVSRTGKSRRQIISYLSRNGVTVKDYDGHKKKVDRDNAVATESLSNQISPTSIQNEIESQQRRSSFNSFEAMNQIDEDNHRSDKYVGIGLFLLWTILTLWGFKTFGGIFFFGWIILTFVMFFAYLEIASSVSSSNEQRQTSQMTPEEVKSYQNTRDKMNALYSDIAKTQGQNDLHGYINENLVCPHCQTKGLVRSKSTVDISSTKVVPIIGNNIKTKKKVTQMHCDNCKTTWNV